MSIKRLIVAGAEPIEIWDLVTDDGDILWNRQHEPQAVANAIESLRAGRAVSRSEGPITAAIGVDSVFLTGGQLLDAQRTRSLVDRLRRTEVRVRCARDPVFGAAAAGSDVWPDALVIDVGQTQVKVVSQRHWAAHSRDLTTLPIHDHATEPAVTASERRAQRDAFVDMVAQAIDRVTALGQQRWSQVVLAMPCSIETDAGGHVRLGGSSFVGMAGDSVRLEQLAELIPEADWWVLNDAELATFAAGAAPQPGERELVVTFGFGLGGCVVNPVVEVGR